MGFLSSSSSLVWFIASISRVLGEGFPLQDLSLPPLQNDFPTKCLGDLGCFETGPPFYHPILRPLVLLPFDEENITTKFSLFTRGNPTEPELMSHEYSTITNSSFNPYCSTKVIIHGFTVQPETNDTYDVMKDALLAVDKYNVILVDWSDSNQPPYFQAVANGRVVGAQLARLIYSLMYYTGAVPERFHIIGHSLGAAVAGWAGERIRGLGRITGLDPAGMYFYLADPEVRLDASDAQFVDVIITNGGTKYEEGIGTLEPIGHVNFYPNGGNIQPGCYNPSEPLKEFDVSRNLCSHMRALQLFIASIFNDQCEFWGTECENYALYKSGHCNEKYWWRRYHSCSVPKKQMGFHATKSNFHAGQMFFLNTTETAPFCTPPKYFNYYHIHRRWY